MMCPLKWDILSCLLSACAFSLVNSAVFPFGVDGVGSSPPSIWGCLGQPAHHLPFCMVPQSSTIHHPAVGISHLLRVENNKIFRGHTLYGGKFISHQRALLENMNQEQLQLATSCPKEQLLPPLMEERNGFRRWANGESKSCVLSWFLP